MNLWFGVGLSSMNLEFLMYTDKYRNVYVHM